MTVLLSGAAGAVFGAMSAALLTWRLNRRERDLALKRDVLRRIFGYRFVLTGHPDRLQLQGGEPFVALNEAWIVFSKCPEVVRALERMHRGLSQGSLRDDLVTLTKAMAKNCDLPSGGFNDRYFVYPFAPSGTGT